MDKFLPLKEAVTPELYSFLEERGLLGKFEQNMKDICPLLLRDLGEREKGIPVYKVQTISEGFVFLFAKEGVQFWFDQEIAFQDSLKKNKK